LLIIVSLGKITKSLGKVQEVHDRYEVQHTHDGSNTRTITSAQTIVREYNIENIKARQSDGCINPEQHANVNELANVVQPKTKWSYRQFRLRQKINHHSKLDQL
jgi:hypothetical protein